tara:strand:- start:11904 stop:12347 length:444 start_codon:yes stop_codon:yes gene_type:complete
MISIRRKDFDIQKELDSIITKSGNDSALSIFIGKVRKEKKLRYLNIDCYPEMAKYQIKQIADNANKRWKINKVRIIHRYGELHPGENIVTVITTANHRQDSLESNAYIMDYLKNCAPFWKKEIYEDHTEWVKQKSSDLLIMEKWDKV